MQGVKEGKVITTVAVCNQHSLQKRDRLRKPHGRIMAESHTVPLRKQKGLCVLRKPRAQLAEIGRQSCAA